MIAKYKPELKHDILSALHKADISVYDDSMQLLVYKDIQKALEEIQKYKKGNRNLRRYSYDGEESAKIEKHTFDCGHYNNVIGLFV